jgi:hypothetical protein
MNPDDVNNLLLALTAVLVVMTGIAVRDSEPKPTLHGWRQIEHNYLEQALVGVRDELPKSAELTQASQPGYAIGVARDAREEVAQALKKLNEVRA